MPPHGHSAMPFSVAHIVVTPEMEVITERVCDAAIDVTGCFSKSLIQQF